MWQHKSWGWTPHCHWSLVCCSLSSLFYGRGCTFEECFGKCKSNKPWVCPTYKVPGSGLVVGCLLLTKEMPLTCFLLILRLMACIFGNDATIGKTPITNILASLPTKPSCVLDVVDCTNHMMAAGKKDAWYIAKQILPLMQHIDPNKIALILFLLMENTISKKQVTI